MELVFFRRIHAVVIKPRFPYGDNFRVGRYDAPDFFYILFSGFICRMRMDTCRPIGMVIFDESIDFAVFPVF